MTTKYRRKPAEVEAWKVGSDDKPEWIEEVRQAEHEPDLFIILVKIDEYQSWKVYAERGDWIINDPELSDLGLSDEEFAALYEVVE